MEMSKRIEKEMIQIRKDFELARECHAEMYKYADETQTLMMDEWDDLLTNDLYDVKEMVENYLQSLSVSVHANTTSSNNEQIQEQTEQSNSNDSPVEAVGGSAESIHEAPEASFS